MARLIPATFLAVVIGSGGLTASCTPIQKPAEASSVPVSPPAQDEKANPPDRIEALAGKWDFACTDMRCTMFTDVLIGDPDHPTDIMHPEHITMAVAINRSTRKPDFFEFDLPANADRNQGVFIAFLSTVKDGASWKLVKDKDSMSQLDFNSCDEKSCIARVHAEILSSDGSPNVDLLGKFLHSTQIWIMFTKKGEPYRTIKALFPFQRDYRRLMETEIKPAVP